jgi:hypothetical protein
MVSIKDKDYIEDPCLEIERLTQEFLDLKRWGFRESFCSTTPKQYSTIIYDSEWCRIRVSWEIWDYLTGNSMHVDYGRLHASNTEGTIIYHGEKCHCWHGLTSDHILDFLDGLSPREAVENMKTQWPRIMERFYQTDVYRSLEGKRREPELTMRMHAFVWEKYGQRLFELFDLQRSDLWEKYRQFLKEYSDLKGRNPDIKPSRDKVC